MAANCCCQDALVNRVVSSRSNSGDSISCAEAWVMSMKGHGGVLQFGLLPLAKVSMTFCCAAP
jgi:hypothetical protein